MSFAASADGDGADDIRIHANTSLGWFNFKLINRNKLFVQNARWISAYAGDKINFRIKFSRCCRTLPHAAIIVWSLKWVKGEYVICADIIRRFLSFPLPHFLRTPNDSFICYDLSRMTSVCMITFYEQWTIPSEHPFHSYLPCLVLLHSFCVLVCVGSETSCSLQSPVQQWRRWKSYTRNLWDLSLAMFRSSLVHDSITVSVPMSAIYISFRKTITIITEKTNLLKSKCVLVVHRVRRWHAHFIWLRRHIGVLLLLLNCRFDVGPAGGKHLLGCEGVHARSHTVALDTSRTNKCFNFHIFLFLRKNCGDNSGNYTIVS